MESEEAWNDFSSAGEESEEGKILEQPLLCSGEEEDARSWTVISDPMTDSDLSIVNQEAGEEGQFVALAEPTNIIQGTASQHDTSESMNGNDMEEGHAAEVSREMPGGGHTEIHEGGTTQEELCHPTASCSSPSSTSASSVCEIQPVAGCTLPEGDWEELGIVRAPSGDGGREEQDGGAGADVADAEGGTRPREGVASWTVATPSRQRWALALLSGMVLGLLWKLLLSVWLQRRELRLARGLAADGRRSLREARATALRFCYENAVLQDKLTAAGKERDFRVLTVLPSVIVRASRVALLYV